MATAPGPRPPRLSLRTEPSGLVASDGSDLLDGDQRDGELYEGVVFGERDLEHTTFTGCAFRRSSLAGARLRGAHFAEVTMAEVDAAELAAPRSSWRSVAVTGSRIGAAGLYESHWRSVVVSGSKIGYLNLRSANLQDVVFRDCTIEELDLGSAAVSRLALDRCQVKTLDVSHARLTDVDLRTVDLHAVKGLTSLAGAWITAYQLNDLAPLLAAELNINVG